MAILKIYKNRYGSVGLVLKDGYVVKFSGGKFWTDNAKVNAELEAMCEAKEAGVYFDPQEPSVDTECMDPLEQIKRKAVAEFLAKNGGIIPDSTYEQGKTKVQSTSDNPMTATSKVMEESQVQAAVVAAASSPDIKAMLAARTAVKK